MYGHVDEHEMRKDGQNSRTCAAYAYAATETSMERLKLSSCYTNRTESMVGQRFQ